MLIHLLLFITIVVTIYLLLIMPALRKNADLKQFKGWLYAHRGFHDNQTDAPENSLKAFQKAVELNFGIELDVQLTKDGVPIIFHDYDLSRACNVNGKISERTYEELKEYHLFQSKETIPTLEEALACIDGKVPIIVELKIPWSAKRTCEGVSKVLDQYKGSYCIESFHPFGLIWYRKNRPNVIRGQLSSDFNKEKIKGSKIQYFILKNLLFNFQTKPNFIAYHHIYKNAISFTLCKKLYRVTTAAWTIQSQEEYDNNIQDFDLFIFEGFLPKRTL